MANDVFDRFGDPSTMIKAEMELIGLGRKAVPILESLFNGEARNEYGVPYRQLGLPLRCAMEVVVRMGPIAKPLEPYLRDEVATDYVAATCLRHMGSLEEDTVLVLAHALGGDGDHEMVAAAATTLVMCGAGDHPRVLAASMKSERARTWLEKARRFAKF